MNKFKLNIDSLLKYSWYMWVLKCSVLGFLFCERDGC